ncbi:MAG: J domain-containing protein [Thermodesulfobacteriota bacterium]|nr:J domain-containing protein [Thermodesulfobacteriota bacterium]
MTRFHSQRIVKDTQKNTRCLSCGTMDNLNGRKYCSVQCRQQLRRQLNLRTGLLKAINTQYATFYFTETLIILDVLVFDSNRIFSYIYPRSRSGKPVDDFIRMANRLGRGWWKEKSRTQRRYLATRHLLDKATSNGNNRRSVTPLELKKPVLRKDFLVCLDLNRADLTSPGALIKIKSAFRRQAMKAHPDRGGSAASFRRIHEAYHQLIAWADRPVFTRRRGFPDRWFYDGITNRWVQPTTG